MYAIRSYYDSIYNNFKYDKEQLFASTYIFGYPKQYLRQLESYISEGEINVDKIMSGEEVILKVPSYNLIQQSNGKIYMPEQGNNKFVPSEAIISKAFNVGDTINLSALLTDKMYNGAVTVDKINDFYRWDKTVKIGAIIRQASARFDTNVAPAIFEIV